MEIELLTSYASLVSEEAGLTELVKRLTPPSPPELVMAKSRLKEISTLKEAERPKIVAHLMTENVDKYSHDLGTFSLIPAEPAWEYSDVVALVEERFGKFAEQLKGELEAFKELERENGTAKKIEMPPSLRFLPPKA